MPIICPEYKLKQIRRKNAVFECKDYFFFAAAFFAGAFFAGFLAAAFFAAAIGNPPPTGKGYIFC